MYKTIAVSLVVILAMSGAALANSQGAQHAASKALDMAAYQSVLVDRYDLPGIRLPVLGGYAEINQDEPCYYVVGWAEPTGKGANDLGIGPGRSNNPERGAGRVTFRMWVDSNEARFHKSGGVRYTRAMTLDGTFIETWFAYIDYWIVFPAFYFDPGEHHLRVQVDASNLAGFPTEWWITLRVNP